MYPSEQCRIAQQIGLAQLANDRKMAAAGQTTADLVSMYQGVERRKNPRNRITTTGVIWRDDPYSIVICSLRDMSPAGAGLVLPDRVSPLPPEFDLTFDRVTRHCIAVWQHVGRMGLKFESA
jgi:hypothetical protein